MALTGAQTTKLGEMFTQFKTTQPALQASRDTALSNRDAAATLEASRWATAVAAFGTAASAADATLVAAADAHAVAMADLKAKQIVYINADNALRAAIDVDRPRLLAEWKTLA